MTDQSQLDPPEGFKRTPTMKTKTFLIAYILQREREEHHNFICRTISRKQNRILKILLPPPQKKDGWVYLKADWYMYQMQVCKNSKCLLKEFRITLDWVSERKVLQRKKEEK